MLNLFSKASFSLDLPLRLAVVEQGKHSMLIHHTNEAYTTHYELDGHPVLEKIEGLFNTLAAELN